MMIKSSKSTSTRDTWSNYWEKKFKDEYYRKYDNFMVQGRKWLEDKPRK